MKKSKFSEEKIISIIREGDAGTKVAELCRKHGMSDASYYKWKAKYAGMDVSQLRRLKDLQTENGRLKADVRGSIAHASGVAGCR